MPVPNFFCLFQVLCLATFYFWSRSNLVCFPFPTSGLGPLIEPMDLDRSNIWPGKLGGSGTVAEIIVDGEDERLEVKVGQQPEAQETLAEKGTQPTRWGVWPGTVQVTI